MINKSMICYNCLGCSKLEDLNFNGVKECKNFKNNKKEDDTKYIQNQITKK